MDKTFDLQGVQAMNPSRKRTLNIRQGRLCAAAFIAMASVAACANGNGVVYNKNFTIGYSPISLSAERPILVETFAVPAAGLSQESVTAATVKGLRDRGPRWAQLSYTGNPADAPDPAYRLRFAYGASKAFSRTKLCRKNLQSDDVGNDGTSARTVAALCRGERYVSIAEGSPGLNADIGSPEFTAFVGLISRQMLPRNNPVVTNECIRRRCD